MDEEPETDRQYDNTTSNYLVGVLLDENIIPKEFVRSFVGSPALIQKDGFAMLHNLIEKLAPSQAAQWLHAIDNLLSLKIDPDTTIDSFFYKIRQIMTALTSLGMEKFFPFLVISVMDPVRFKGVKDSFYANNSRVVDADIFQLEEMMWAEERSRILLEGSQHPSRRPQAQRATQGGTRPQDSDTNTPSTPPVSPLNPVNGV